MLVPVSDGELVDKYTVLQLKLEKITNRDKLHEVRQEQTELHDLVQPLHDKYPLHYKLLYHVNKLIWEKTDEIKVMEVSDPLYAPLAHEIFCLNDKRFRLKSVFNRGSQLKEQKSYEEKGVSVQVRDVSLCVENKLPELYFLSVEYDKLFLEDEDQDPKGVLRKRFPYFSVRNQCTRVIANVILDDFIAKDRLLFE